jgi:1-aminocyclopropane-1-carboxylate deaminase/D-cysteine desulfhydrase-like pyridoxal-dependent ACC family enzyme
VATPVEPHGPPRLRARFGELALPWVSLGTLPTPVERQASLSAELGAEVWLKRDDRSGALYGGNKVRKLELLLGEALATGRRSVVTTGAYGSHHCLATATYGALVGLDVHLVLSPQGITEHVLDDLLLDHAAGATLHHARSAAAKVELARRVAARLERPYLIPGGGSNARGAVGFVEAGLELAEQVAAGELPAPDLIVVAAGTCGTVAGLALGLELAGLKSTVLGVRVVPAILTNRPQIARLRRACADLLSSAGVPAGASQSQVEVELDPHELGPGYGLETDASRAALTQFAAHGVQLEETYTAKAAAALQRRAGGDAAGKRILFWVTFSSVDLSHRLPGVDPSALPPAFHPALRAGGRL